MDKKTLNWLGQIIEFSDSLLDSLVQSGSEDDLIGMVEDLGDIVNSKKHTAILIIEKEMTSDALKALIAFAAGAIAKRLVK